MTASSSSYPAPEDEQYNAYVGRIARGAGISLSGQGIGRVLNYATQIALAWMYGPAQLGLYVLGLTLIQIANILSQFGMDNGVVRYVAYYRAERDVSRVRGTILLSLFVTFALSLVLACAVFFGAGFLNDTLYHKPALEMIFKIFSISLPLLTVMNIALYATVGFQTVKYLISVQQIVQPLANVVLIVVFYLLGAQILGAVAAYVVSTLVGAIIALFYLKRIFPKLTDRETPTKFEARALFSTSWPLILSNFTQRINSWTAVMVLGIFSTASAVGIYNTAARTAMLSALVLFAFNSIFSPIISSLHKRGLLDDLGRLYQDVSRWVFTGGFTIFLLTVVLGKDILAVLGSAFVSGWVVLVIVAGAQLFNSSVGPTQRVLAMTGHQRVLMLATTGSAVIGVAANILLVPLYGALGAGIATAAAIVLMNAITLLYVRRLLGFWPYSRSYVKPAVAGIIATAGVYIVKLVLPFSPGIHILLICGPLFLIGFMALVLIFGLSASDRQLLEAFWSGILRVLRRETQTASS